ncbi:MAG TPA: hypothetical protein VNF73_01080 [Candidatus Saccharimonadales bacterium]|nr:hypothetical protein [Candidatus Saccharimonadales bacterium]
MAIFASLFAAIGQQANRFLTAALGWASTLLFGRVPKNKQILIVLITLGSILWVVMLVGIVFPGIGTFLLAALPIPKFIDQNWVRLAMLIGALVTPVLIGILGLFVVDAAQRPKGATMVKEVLRGYPLAFVLAFILIFLAIVGVMRKVRNLSRRWTDAHIPVVVRSGGYDTVVTDLEQALREAGLPVDRRAAPAALSLPARLVAKVAGGGVESLVAQRLVQLHTPGLEIDVYPSDIAMSGQKAIVARARAAIASRLTATAAHLTTSRESQAIEDRIEQLAQVPPEPGSSTTSGLPAGVSEALRALDETLAQADIDYTEWELLYRMRLQVERDLLIGAEVGETFAGGVTQLVTLTSARPGFADWAMAATVAAAVTLDLGLAVWERARAARR